MKLSIDFDNHIITVEKKVNFSKLMDALIKMLPTEDFDKYELDTNTVVQWNSYPVYKYYPDWNRYYSSPFWSTTGTNVYNTGTNSASQALQDLSGKKNFEIE